MSIENEVQYRLKFTCDGCGNEAFYNSNWELPDQGHTYLPMGWAHFLGVSVTQINDVCRSGRSLDFCAACLTGKNIKHLIECLPFDHRSLKTTIIPSDHDIPVPGSTG